jgi:hypothetical protein
MGLISLDPFAASSLLPSRSERIDGLIYLIQSSATIIDPEKSETPSERRNIVSDLLIGNDLLKRGRDLRACETFAMLFYPGYQNKVCKISNNIQLNSIIHFFCVQSRPEQTQTSTNYINFDLDTKISYFLWRSNLCRRASIK